MINRNGESANQGKFLMALAPNFLTPRPGHHSIPHLGRGIFDVDVKFTILSPPPKKKDSIMRRESQDFKNYANKKYSKSF